MRVLLLSPTRGLDSPNGDVSYTESLLSSPPEGVEYVTYADALRDGTLIEHGRRHTLSQAFGWRRGVLRELGLLGLKHFTDALRRRGHLFREPCRFFSLKSSAYDLVHIHVFSCRFLKIDCPIVMSAGAPIFDVYQAVWGYTPAKISSLICRETLLARRCGTNTNSCNLPQVNRLIVWTNHCREDYLQRGLIAPDRIDHVPSFLPSLENRFIHDNGQSGPPRRVGFVAKNFKAKGGEVLIEAFRRVRAACPDAELVIVGSDSQGEATEPGVVWMRSVPREQLLDQIMPTFDVFAYPTEFDCISYVTLEAMHLGIAVTVSDYPSMPEVVDKGKAGLISPVGDVRRLTENILRLLDPDENRFFRQAALERFEERYSANVVPAQLKASYNKAAEANSHKDETIEA